MLRVRGKLRTEPAVGTSDSAWPPPVFRALVLSLHSPLRSGRGDPHLPGVREDRWGYQNWGGLWHNDLHVGVPGRTPSVLLAPMPRAWLVCWALAQGCWASLHRPLQGLWC